MSYFEALHLLLALARGAEIVHGAGERLGSLAPHTVLVRRLGLGFDVKLLALAGESSNAAARREDGWRLLELFALLVGGEEGLARIPAEVKAVCAGMKKQAVLSRYSDASELRRALSTMRWS